VTAILTAKPADNKTRKEAPGEHQQTSAKNVYFPDIISSSIWSADWAVEMIPYSRPLSPKQAAKQAYGGLKAREREIAALIAQGKFNREIADVLVLILRAISPEIYVLPSRNLRTVRDDNARRSGYNCSVSRGNNPLVRSTGT